MIFMTIGSMDVEILISCGGKEFTTIFGAMMISCGGLPLKAKESTSPGILTFINFGRSSVEAFIMTCSMKVVILITNGARRATTILSVSTKRSVRMPVNESVAVNAIANLAAR